VGPRFLHPSDPDPADGKFRDENSPIALTRPDPNDPSTWSYPTPNIAHYNPSDIPKTLTRDKRLGRPPVGKTLKAPFGGPNTKPDWTIVPSGTTGAVSWPTDDELINAPTWDSFNNYMQGGELGTSNSEAHGLAHQYIGGDLADAHISFRDPFVFLLHSNVDRLWATWQLSPGHPERLDPEQVYGTQGNTIGRGNVEDESEANHAKWGILSPLEPWAGLAAQTMATGIVKNVWPSAPWFTEPEIKNSKHPSIVKPPVYAPP